MKGLAVLLTKPVAGVEWQQLDLGAFRQAGRFVHNQTAGRHAGLDRHGARLAFDVLPNMRLYPTATAPTHAAVFAINNLGCLVRRAPL